MTVPIQAAQVGSTSPLRRRGWRFLNSLWLIVPIAGLGAFSFLGFLYCAIRALNAKLWITAAVTFPLTVAGYRVMAAVPAPPAGSPPNMAADVALGYVIALWFGQAIYACIANRGYPRNPPRAEAKAWYERPAGAWAECLHATVTFLANRHLPRNFRGRDCEISQIRGSSP